MAVIWPFQEGVRDMGMMARLAAAIGWRGDPPVSARHAAWSIISSADDLRPAATPELIDISIRAIRDASEHDLVELPKRTSGEASVWARQWPGEHYRLLPALARTVAARAVIEVGTFTGMGTIALAESRAHVTTYDIEPWYSFPDSVIRESDTEIRITPRLGDLADPSFFESELDRLAAADMIFVDGPKDTAFEPQFSSLLVERFSGSGKLLVFDDIRLLNMVQFWRDLPLQKLDLTSFGHWSGTGVAIL